MQSSLSRRTILAGAAAGVASSALLPVPGAFAQMPPRNSSTDLITRPIGRTGEVVPALGLGTFLTFDVLPGEPRDRLGEVVRRYWEGGVRVLDTSPLYGTGETSAGDFISSLGINDRLFIANKVWSTGDFLADESHARRSLEQSQQRLWRRNFDLVQCHSLVNVDVVIPILQAWKKEGRTRFIGVTHHENDYHPLLANWIDKGVVDFVQVNYSIYNRHAEQRVLAAAQARGVGVLVNMAMEKARLHKVVADRPMPAFAREIAVENWAQYFLKFVMSHPAVTCCLSSTSNPVHAAENVGALRGPLPDREMRERMIRHMESIPGFSDIGRMPWYPDKRYTGIIGRSQSEIRARAAS